MKVSFKALVNLNKPRKDKTFSVVIRIGYKSNYAYIDTGYAAGKNQLKEKKKKKQKIGEINNAYLTDICNKKIAKYRELLTGAGLSEGATVQEIKELLLSGTTLNEPLNFVQQFEKYLEQKGKSAGYRTYAAAYNHLRSFAGIKLLISDITPNKLKEFENYLTERMGSAGVNLYMSRIKAVYRWVMGEYEHKGYQFAYPFRKYEMPKARYAPTVSLSKEQLRSIVEAPLKGIRANRARDLFVISLLTLGTNAKDLYMLDSIGKRIEYKRSKTKKKRADEAFISLEVQPELKPYLSKYAGSVKALSFAELYKNPDKLNSAIYYGMKQVVAQINKIHGDGFLWNIDYYDARRTMASVMSNTLHIGTDDVAKCLNHVDDKYRTTRPYIEQDFSVLDRCNRSFIDWLFAD